MRKTNILCLAALCAYCCLVSIACSESQVTVLEACAVQETEDDCLSIGQNILALSEEFVNYECVWQNDKCISQLR